MPKAGGADEKKIVITTKVWVVARGRDMEVTTDNSKWRWLLSWSSGSGQLNNRTTRRLGDARDLPVTTAQTARPGTTKASTIFKCAIG
jgi:hypothetical protein